MSKVKLDEINRNIYDIKNKDEYDYKIKIETERWPSVDEGI